MKQTLLVHVFPPRCSHFGIHSLYCTVLFCLVFILFSPSPFLGIVTGKFIPLLPTRSIIESTKVDVRLTAKKRRTSATSRRHNMHPFMGYINWTSQMYYQVPNTPQKLWTGKPDQWYVFLLFTLQNYTQITRQRGKLQLLSLFYIGIYGSCHQQLLLDFLLFYKHKRCTW